jgi:hypothetical protein
VKESQIPVRGKKTSFPVSVARGKNKHLGVSMQSNVWLRVNQAGYTPNRNKTAVVLSNIDISGSNWNIKKDGHIILHGILADGKTGNDIFIAQNYFYKIDFSPLKETGTYTLELDGAQTQQVIISEDPYSIFVSQALIHLRAMRSGCPTLYREQSHLKDDSAIIYNVKGEWTNGAWQEASPRRTVDMLGGHYDAGDYIKFTLNEAYLAWHLLRAYQINPSIFAKSNSVSGLTDILDEAKYCLDYLAKTFPDENTFIIQVGDGKDHRQGLRLPENDLLDGERPALCALSRVHMGSAAAALALGAQIFKDIDSIASALYESKAIAIYERARKSDTQRSAFERDATNDFYNDNTDIDNMALAAAELYNLTKNQKYLTEGSVYAPPAAAMVSWGSWNSFANYRLAELGDEAAKDRLLEETIKYEQDNVWSLPSAWYGWSTLHRWIGAVNAHLLSQRLIGNKDFSAPFLGILDYTFGCNNWGIAMLASKDLPYSVNKIYNQIYRLTGVFPTGALSEGPAGRKLHEKMRSHFNVPANSPFDEFNTSGGVFYDNEDDFVIQESTVGGQADIILMLALAAAE